MKKSLSILAALLAAILFAVACGQAPASSVAPSGVSSAIPSASQPDSVASATSQASSVPPASSADSLLQTIISEAGQGKVLDCEYAVDGVTIESVDEAWGPADDSQYSDAGKGTYYTYSERHVVFDANKGSLVFEIRSYAPSLAGITYDAVIAALGAPEYTATTEEGEAVIGYTRAYTGGEALATLEAGKLKFVFPNDTGAATVSHYMVLDPTQTADLMADDPGREW